MKTAIITAALLGIFTLPAHASDTTLSPGDAGQGIEERRTEFLQHIEERIANSGLELTCVLTAATLDDLQACRDKYRPRQKLARRVQNPQP